MQIVYFDEVKPDLNAGRSAYVIGGLCFKPEDISAVEMQVQKIALEVFGNDSLTKETEFHAKDIFGGKANFKGVDIDTRIEILSRLSELISGEACKKVYAWINTDKLYYPEDGAKFAFQHFVERADLCCRRAGPSILIGDLDAATKAAMISDFQTYRAEGTPTKWGVELRSVIDTVHFAASHHSRLIQLADIYNFILVHRTRDQEKYPVKKFSEHIATLDLFPSNYKVWPS